MNRRTFLKGLGLVTTALAVAPKILIEHRPAPFDPTEHRGNWKWRVEDMLSQEASRLSEEIYTRSLHTSPWIDLIDTKAFPENMGDTIRTMTYAPLRAP